MNGVFLDTRRGGSLPVRAAAGLRALLLAVSCGLVAVATQCDSVHGAPPLPNRDVPERFPVESSRATPFEEEPGADDETPDVLAAVIVEGNVTITSEEIAKHIKTRARRPVSEKQIKDDVRALYATKWFLSVERRYRDTPEGRVLVFHVRERPILGRVEYKGNKKIKEKDLSDLTGLKVGGAFDVGLNREAARRIESHYREKGFIFAEVSL
jgi:outer membrane protein insertion porin family